jgi:hypothetical protein
MSLKKIIFIAFCLVIFSCKKEESSSASEIAVGHSYAGGVIFYVDGSGQHGLIAAESDCCDSVQWYNGSFVITNTIEVEVGQGQSNTTKIIQTQGDGIYAASICDQLVLNGYSDWFLPSKSELNLLFQKRNMVGSFSNNYYWSSTEYDTLKAWNQYFPFGPQYFANKSSMASVRAIRAF